MLSFSTALPSERLEALTVLYGGLPVGEREQQLASTLEAAQSGALPLDDLLIARQDGKLCGVLPLVSHAGNIAYLWPPAVRPATPEAEAVVDGLLQKAGTRMDDRQMVFTQCLLPPDDSSPVPQQMIRNGFLRSSRLQLLIRGLAHELPERPQARLQETGYSPSLRPRFAQVVERSYLQSLDCPALHGIRTADEAMQAHRAVTPWKHCHWRLYSLGSEDLAVLLTSDVPEQQETEVAYLGVVPEGRGRSYAREMLIGELYRAREAGALRVHVAVDSQNIYAQRVYRDLGFAVGSLLDVYLRIHPDRQGERHRQVVHSRGTV
jgi:ribosomal protein S18 acetylase RimI-like enzyme